MSLAQTDIIMTTVELRKKLAAYPRHELRFILPDGTSVPAHAHVTEVARIEKRFVDCGGTLRNDALCRLQVWVSDDLEHRLAAGKLLGILEKATAVLGKEDLEVDIEYEIVSTTQFLISSIEPLDETLTFKLTPRHTACLAEDRCLPKPVVAQSIGFAAFKRNS
ncbi:MAG TPA: DUF6428 family protein [Candidatus Limnocylindria bacterium]|jgi:hypothetical protein|nr:DUF6428 family protein [Candidatus Limnocylindria bacterium]